MNFRSLSVVSLGHTNITKKYYSKSPGFQRHLPSVYIIIGNLSVLSNGSMLKLVTLVNKHRSQPLGHSYLLITWCNSAHICQLMFVRDRVHDAPINGFCPACMWLYCHIIVLATLANSLFGFLLTWSTFNIVVRALAYWLYTLYPPLGSICTCKSNFVSYNLYISWAWFLIYIPQDGLCSTIYPW